MRLRDSLPDYVVSSMYTGSTALSAFLCEVVASFSSEYLAVVTRMKLYRDLADAFLSVPLYPRVFVLGSERDVLKRVQRMPGKSLR